MKKSTRTMGMTKEEKKEFKEVLIKMRLEDPEMFKNLEKVFDICNKLANLKA